jgi:hypothetical protein
MVRWFPDRFVWKNECQLKWDIKIPNLKRAGNDGYFAFS